MEICHSNTSHNAIVLSMLFITSFELLQHTVNIAYTILLSFGFKNAGISRPCCVSKGENSNHKYESLG